MNDCNKIVTQILHKKGFLKKKFIGTNWEQWYQVKGDVTLKTFNGKKTTAQWNTKNAPTYKTIWPCKVALKKFQKAWNKKKLKPSLKANGQKDANTLKALKRYKEL